MKRNRLTTLHSISGLFAGIFILLLSVSGTILLFRDNIDVLQQPKVGLINGISQKISADSGHHIIRNQYPHAQISSLALPEKDQQPFIFTIYDSSYANGSKPMQVLLHPQTGAVLQTRGGADDPQHNFMSWLASFHSSFLAGKKGEWFLGVLAVVFALSLFSGIIIYRRNIIPVLLFRKTVWKKSNLHQLIGTWALLFNLLMSVTGFWMQRYVFKASFYKNYDWKNTITPSAALSFSFDSAYLQVQEKYPQFTAYVVYFPTSKSGKTAVYGSNSTNAYIHAKKFADVISLDSTGHIASTRFINEISADDRYDIINSQLHMGKYGSWGVKLLYAFFGISSALLSITGFRLWWKRRGMERR
ncbi:MAG: PepSY domain-containing protein [Bacteroidetes bacterium]|nr:PepSY domain-containing protein [Bacteroidota bacterium]